jgi:hypothetical protein
VVELMKKIIAIVIIVNTAFLLWLYVIYPHSHRGNLDIFCESTLNMSNDRSGSVFTFGGTVITRFKSDSTGYIGLLGAAEYQGKTYNVSREVGFTYEPKDDDGIYAIKLGTISPMQADNIPNELVEYNITGRAGIINSYVLRHANENTWSIGNIYTPIVMCVDKLR